METMADDSPGSRYITLQEEYIKDEQRYVFGLRVFGTGCMG